MTAVSKKKQGRPKGHQRQVLDSGLRSHSVDGCERTKVNWVFMLDVLNLINNASEDVQRIVWGCTARDLESGNAKFPKGWTTFTPEIGRYIADASDDEKQTVLNVIVDARQRGLSWSDIGAHFRTLRLGERSGNKPALIAAICRAIDQFRKQFPKTSQQVVTSALGYVQLAIQGEANK